MRKRKESQNIQNMRERSDIFLSQPGPSTKNMRERSDSFLSQPDSSTRSSALSQRSSRRTRINQLSQESNISTQANVLSQGLDSNDLLISSTIRYLLMADGSKQIIQKNHIIKNILNGDNKLFRSIIAEVKRQLFAVFGYKLKEVENNRYILVNDIENHLPHLLYNDNDKQVLLFLVLMHIFMHGKSCKEEILWHYLRNLNIITENSFQHEYFGDVKQLVTIDFVNQRYLAKVLPDKNDPSVFEYVWGSRAENEITYRSCLEFVAKIYGCSLNKWNLQYKAMIEQERSSKE